MIRYKIDVLEELKKNGVSQYDILKKNLLSQGSVTKIRNGGVVSNERTLNFLCETLELQPGDIIEYVKSEE